MRLVFISDTHGFHDEFSLPEGDILLHSGDFTAKGTVGQVQLFLDWFAAQPHRHKVFIAGNHDFLCEREPVLFRDMVPDNCIYLNDSGTEIEGLSIWGSPIQPWFYDWAFNRQRGADIRRHWGLIPEDTQILLTHGPPYGIQDRLANGELVGCEDLLQKISSLPQLKIHAFGHIHEAHGQSEQSGIHYLNASVLDLHYRPVYHPTVVNLDDSTGEVRSVSSQD